MRSLRFNLAKIKKSGHSYNFGEKLRTLFLRHSTFLYKKHGCYTSWWYFSQNHNNMQQYSPYILCLKYEKLAIISNTLTVNFNLYFFLSSKNIPFIYNSAIIVFWSLFPLFHIRGTLEPIEIESSGKVSLPWRNEPRFESPLEGVSNLTLEGEQHLMSNNVSSKINWWKDSIKKPKKRRVLLKEIFKLLIDISLFQKKS